MQYVQAVPTRQAPAEFAAADIQAGQHLGIGETKQQNLPAGDRLLGQPTAGVEPPDLIGLFLAQLPAVWPSAGLNAGLPAIRPAYGTIQGIHQHTGSI